MRALTCILILAGLLAGNLHAAEKSLYALLVTGGFVTLESGNTISIRNAAGVASELPSNQIKKREKISASSMPPGLVAGLTPEQLADLLAYLDSI